MATIVGEYLRVSPEYRSLKRIGVTSYAYAYILHGGAGISIDGTNVISNTAQGSPNWGVTVFNSNVECQMDGDTTSAIKFP